MIELATIKDLLDLGATGVLLVFTVTLYRRVNELTDRVFTYLEAQEVRDDDDKLPDLD